MKVDAFAEAANPLVAADGNGPIMSAGEGAQIIGTRDTIEHLQAPVDIVFRTTTPGKWYFFDAENGQAWGHDGHAFYPLRIDDVHNLACEASLTAKMMRDSLRKT